MVNSLSILGSTGSIGTQTLDVADKLSLKVSALTASTNIKLLEEQVRKYEPELAVVFNEEKAKEFKDNIKDTNTRVLSGMNERWKGLYPVAWGEALRESEYTQWIYGGVCGME